MLFCTSTDCVGYCPVTFKVLQKQTQNYSYIIVFMAATTRGYIYIYVYILPPFVIQSVQYKTVSTTYAAEPKILHCLFSTCLAEQYSNEHSPVICSHICQMIFTKIWLLNLLVWIFFSLLGSSSSSVNTSSFGCAVILSLYLTLNFVISSLIVGTFRSACKTLLDIFHGAFTIARRTLSWYLCNIAMFELLAVPQMGTQTI
jgi:hypothetical protein